MLSTYVSYQVIMRDLPKALDRVEKQPTVSRETDYYLENITKVKSIDEFVSNRRLFSYAMKAFGLEDMTYAKALMVKALKGGVADPDSFANRLNDKRYREFVAAFDFAAYGQNATVYNKAQHDVTANYARLVTSTHAGEMAVKYTAQITAEGGSASSQAVKDEINYYSANIGKVTSIDDFLKDDRLLNYALKAAGLDRTVVYKNYARTLLVGGLTDPNSPGNTATDPRIKAFVTSLAPLGLTGGASGATQTETSYYLANIVKVKSIDGLLKDDRLLNYALKAYGFDPATVNKDTLREMLEGGIADPKSPANTSTDKKYKAFVSAFNFQALGETTTTLSQAQQPAVDRYMRQTLEEAQGDQNEGVQLALYFERKAPGIKSFYDVLADKALSKVLYTALGLPDSFASADIDKQVAYFEKKLKIEDFQDTAKLGKFMKRFTSLWDATNQSATATNPALLLLSKPTEAGISTNLLLTLQQMKRR